MKIKLPQIAEILIEASNEKNIQKYIFCFTENAIYVDVGENETIVGKKAIEKNFNEMKYEVHSEPIYIEEGLGTITMRVKATGNFKGSPLYFEYQMKLESGLIQDLKIDLIR